MMADEVVEKRIDCWHMPPAFFKQKVRLRNRKYCWLYPQETECKLQKIEPDFSHCKSYYSKCDFQLEACVHHQILKLDKEFDKYHTLFECEREKQLDWIDRLWVLSQRYLLLTRAGVCVKLYPEVVSKPTEHRILVEFKELLAKIKKSNCKLSDSIEALRNEMKELVNRCNRLDWTVDSVYINGNSFFPSLKEIRTLIDDVFEYIYGVLCTLKRFAILIEPSDAYAIDDYKLLVAPGVDYETYIVYEREDTCKCLRINNPECIHEHIPC